MLLERGADRRRFQRLRLHMNVSFRIEAPVYARVWFGEQEMDADMVDISEQGMGILTRQDIPVLTTLRLRFSLYKLNPQGEVDFSAPLEVSGEVRSNNSDYCSDSREEHRLGICFVRRENDSSSRIADFMRAAV